MQGGENMRTLIRERELLSLESYPERGPLLAYLELFLGPAKRRHQAARHPSMV